MKISVITCTYNRSIKIIKTIESVILQNYDDYEHFIIDDGSDDNTFEIVKKYNSPQLKYIKLNNNYGQPGALFKSNIFNLVSGNLVMLLDSDDFIFEGFFDLIINDFNYYKNRNIQKIGYNWSDNLKNQKIIFNNKRNIRFVKSSEIFEDDHPLNEDNRGYKDYLFVCTSNYWKLRKSYFISPKHWYVSQYDIAIRNPYNEMFTNTVVYYMSLDGDSVTKGKNFKKYSPITLFTRKYIFEEFNEIMSSKYYNYAFFSMMFNFIIFPNNKFLILKNLFSKKILKIKRIDRLVVLFFSLLFRSSTLYKIKFYLKSSRSRR